MPLRFSTLYRKTKPPVEISLILGWGEGIFARLLPFPFRLSKRKAKGRGCGGNSAFLLPNQNEASPATLQFIAKHHRKILFSLGEKEKKKKKVFFSGVGRGEGATAGVPARKSFSVGGASLVGVLLKESSNI